MKICCLLLLVLVPLHAQDQSLIQPQKRTIPRWAWQEFRSHRLDRTYAVTYQLYPWYYRGDFNGDGRRDEVILVSHKKTGKLGIVIFHGKYPQAMRTRYFVLGAGASFGPSDDAKWITSWNMIPEEKITTVLGKIRLPSFVGDILEIEGKNGARGLIYWSGKKYDWFRLKK